MEVTHEHRRSHTLAGDIPQHKEQAAVRFEKVAVVAAHHAGGLIVETHVPPCGRQTGFRQESALDARGKREIALQGTLFRTRKMVEAEAHQRIGQQAFLFNSVMARLAKPECSLIDAAERGIHSRQELRKRSISGGGTQTSVKARAARLPFRGPVRLFGSEHRTSYRRLLFCG